SLSTINLLGVENPFSHGFDLILHDSSVKAGAVSGMAGSPAELFHLQKEGIVVTIQVGLLDDLQVAGGLALEPELFAGTGPEAGLPCLLGLGPAFGVHVGNHQ